MCYMYIEQQGDRCYMCIEQWRYNPYCNVHILILSSYNSSSIVCVLFLSMDENLCYCDNTLQEIYFRCSSHKFQKAQEWLMLCIQQNSNRLFSFQALLDSNFRLHIKPFLFISCYIALHLNTAKEHTKYSPSCSIQIHTHEGFTYFPKVQNLSRNSRRQKVT